MDVCNELMRTTGDVRGYPSEVVRIVTEKYPASADNYQNLQKVRNIKANMDKILFETHAPTTTTQPAAPTVVGAQPGGPADGSRGNLSGGMLLPGPGAIWDDIFKFIQIVESQMVRSSGNFVTAFKSPSNFPKSDLHKILKQVAIWGDQTRLEYSPPR